MKRDIILISLAVTIGLALLGCYNQTAGIDPYHDTNDCDQWLSQTAPQDFDYKSDLSLPGRYPWCDALDTYFLAYAIWQYSALECTEQSPRLLCRDID